jgi:ketosteroid isomerase-like protein
MITWTRGWTLAAVLMASIAVAQGERDLDTLEAWVTDQGERYLELYDAGEIDAIVEPFADDFLLREITGDLYAGPDAYVAVVQGYHDAGARLSAVGPKELGYLADDVAFSVWGWTFVGASGDVLAQGESLYVYRRTDAGDWAWVMQYSAPMLPGE